jgi:hypothetical protein
MEKYPARYLGIFPLATNGEALQRNESKTLKLSLLD